VSQQTLETAPKSPAEEHQTGQTALVSLIPALLREAWPLLDLSNLQATMPAFTAAVKAIVARYGKASSAAALDYYHSERIKAGVPGRPSLRVVDVQADAIIEDTIRWAVSDLAGTLTPEAEATALKRLDSAVAGLVLDQGRATVVESVTADKYAKGWVRVTSPGACSFCIMLALRASNDLLYTSQASASFRAHVPNRKTGTGGLCQCGVEAVFTAYEPSAKMREAQKLWEDATRGRSGADARTAFRQAVDGTPITGRTGVTQPKAGTAAKGLTPAFINNQIKILTGLKDSPYRTKRLAELHKLAVS